MLRPACYLGSNTVQREQTAVPAQMRCFLASLCTHRCCVQAVVRCMHPSCMQAMALAHCWAQAALCSGPFPPFRTGPAGAPRSRRYAYSSYRAYMPRFKDIQATHAKEAAARAARNETDTADGKPEDQKVGCCSAELRSASPRSSPAYALRPSVWHRRWMHGIAAA